MVLGGMDFIQARTGITDGHLSGRLWNFGIRKRLGMGNYSLGMELLASQGLRTMELGNLWQVWSKPLSCGMKITVWLETVSDYGGYSDNNTDYIILTTLLVPSTHHKEIDMADIATHTHTNIHTHSHEHTKTAVPLNVALNL